MLNTNSDSKRSNNSNKSNSERKNTLDLQEDINKTSNRSEHGSDKRDGLVETERVEGRPSFNIGNLCSSGNENNNTDKIGESEDDDKNVLSKSLFDYFKEGKFKSILKQLGFGDDAQKQITNKYNSYIEKFDKNEIDKDKLKTKLLNYFKDIKDKNKTEKNTKNIEKIDEIRKEIKDIYKSSENSGNKMFDDISKIEDNDNDKSDLDIPKLDLSYMNYDEELNNTFGNENTGNIQEELEKKDKNKDSNNLFNTGEVEKMEVMDNDQHNTNNNISSTTFRPSTNSNDNNNDNIKDTIEYFAKVFINTFGFHISDEKLKMITDLVVDTIKYIEEVEKFIKEYGANKSVENMILDVVKHSFSKRDLNEKLDKLSNEKVFMSASNKHFLEAVKKRVNDESICSKIKSYFSKKYTTLYDKALKLTGSKDLPNNQIEKAAREKFNKTHNEIYSKFNSMDNMDEYEKTKGYTVEESDKPEIDWYELDSQGMLNDHNEGLLTQSGVEHSNTGSYCNNFVTGVACTLLMQAMYAVMFQIENGYDDFGSSGF